MTILMTNTASKSNEIGINSLDEQEAPDKALTERLEGWREDFRPETAHQEWLFSRAASQSSRLDRFEKRGADLRAYLARRAEYCWDGDRRLEAEEIAGGLAKKPGLTVEKLKSFKQGCQWLIARWRSLESQLVEDRTLTEPQIVHFRNLLGEPLEDRGAVPKDWLVAGSPAAQAIAEREILRLESLKSAVLEKSDRDERAAAIAGNSPVEPRALKDLDRQAASCERSMKDAWKRLEALQKRKRLPKDDPAPVPSPSPSSVLAAPARAEKAEPITKPSLAAPESERMEPFRSSRPESLAHRDKSRPKNPRAASLDDAPRPSPSPIPTAVKLAASAASPGPLNRKARRAAKRHAR